MITLTIVKNTKVNGKPVQKREIKIFPSLDKAKLFASPIATDMRICKKLKQTPKVSIVAVSYDTDYEKQMLIQIGAITTNENEPTDY